MYYIRINIELYLNQVRIRYDKELNQTLWNRIIGFYRLATDADTSIVLVDWKRIKESDNWVSFHKALKGFINGQ